MWTVAHYLPAALFSLKPATATSSGGKTLICPTPFAIKMALLDAAIRTRGLSEAQVLWQEIRDLRIMLHLPAQITVVNTFTKIVRPKKNGATDDTGSGLATPLGSTIAYREYVSFSGAFSLAFQMSGGTALHESLRTLLYHITYLGKRGGFIQLLAPPEEQAEADLHATLGWVLITAEQSSFSFDGTLQVLDDCGPKLGFEHVDIYSGKRMNLGKDRILRHIVLPYRVIRSSRSFSLYERIGKE